MAELSGVRLDDVVPDAWRWKVSSRLGYEPPRSMGDRDFYDLPREDAERVLALTADRIHEVREAVFPHLGLTP